MDLDLLLDDAANAGGDTSTVVSLCKSMVELEKEIEAIKLDLSAKEKALKQLQTEFIPDALDEIGMRDFTLSNGIKIEVKPVLSVSIPSKTAINKAKDDEREELVLRLQNAMKFLRDNNAESLIKNTLTIGIGKGEDAVASELEAVAKSLNLDCEREEKVHPSTLTSWARERLERGLDIPMETFSLFEGRIAMVAKK